MHIQREFAMKLVSFRGLNLHSPLEGTLEFFASPKLQTSGPIKTQMHTHDTCRTYMHAHTCVCIHKHIYKKTTNRTHIRFCTGDLDMKVQASTLRIPKSTILFAICFKWIVEGVNKTVASCL